MQSAAMRAILRAGEGQRDTPRRAVRMHVHVRMRVRAHARMRMRVLARCIRAVCLLAVRLSWMGRQFLSFSFSSSSSFTPSM